MYDNESGINNTDNNELVNFNAKTHLNFFVETFSYYNIDFKI